MADPHANSELADRMAHLKTESVLSVSGKVVARPEDTLNPNLKTGDIAVEADEIEIFNVSDTPPFPIEDEAGDRVNEERRLTYVAITRAMDHLDITLTRTALHWYSPQVGWIVRRLEGGTLEELIKYERQRR